MGAVPGPFSCYLALRGVKTLHLRMREHEKNAFEVARFLNTSPHVKKVVYPGLCRIRFRLSTATEPSRNVKLKWTL